MEERPKPIAAYLAKDLVSYLVTKYNLDPVALTIVNPKYITEHIMPEYNKSLPYVTLDLQELLEHLDDDSALGNLTSILILEFGSVLTLFNN